MLSSKAGKTTKVVVCGMKGVGKTSMLEQVIYGKVDAKTEFPPTIEDTYVASIESERGTKERIRFYDTAGIKHTPTSTSNGPMNQQLPRHYLNFADGYLLVYDTEKSESLDVLVTLKKDIDKNKEKKEVTIIVVGNQVSPHKKPSSPTHLETTVSKASVWCAREKIRHFVVNAMQRSSLYETFIHLASRLNPPPTKSTFPQLTMGRKLSKNDSN